MDDYDAMEDEAFPPLPPPQSPGQGGEDDHEPFDNGEKAPGKPPSPPFVDLFLVRVSQEEHIKFLSTPHGCRYLKHVVVRPPDLLSCGVILKETCPSWLTFPPLKGE